MQHVRPGEAEYRSKLDEFEIFVARSKFSALPISNSSQKKGIIVCTSANALLTLLDSCH